MVELSIVLVILGLLVGGILAGQSLIRAAELRAATTESQRYITAVNAFRDKYFGLPGDITNATSFWGKDTTNCNSDPGSAGTPGTCNGNNDGRIAWNNEGYRAWQQLSAAGLIEGNYTGTATSNAAVIGTNVPASKLNGAGWSFVFETADYITSAWNGMVLGGAIANMYTMNLTVLKPEEVWNIDTKNDDGKPGTGIVRSLSNSYGDGTCTTGTTAPTAAYNLSVVTKSCSLYFSLGK